MNFPNWGTVAGVLAGLYWKLTDRKRRIDAQIDQVEGRLKAITGIPGREQLHADLIERLSRLRTERAKIKE